MAIPVGKYRALMKLLTPKSELKMCGDLTVQIIEKNGNF